MRPRMSVGCDPRTIALVRAPIDEAFVVVWKEHGPLRSRQLAYALLARAGGIESDLMAALAIRVGARVDRIRQHMIDGDVAGVDPAHAAAIAGLHRERQAFGAQPQPDAAHRSELGEACEHGADGAAHGFIWMEAHLAIVLTPHEAYGKPAAQFAARCLVADAAEQACAQHIQLGLAYGALQAKQQSIVEHGGVIDAVGIADERVGEAAEIEQAIPVGIVAGEAGDLETEHDPDMSKRDFRGEPREAAAFDDAGARKPEVFVDDDDLLRQPAERGCPGGQGILALCGLAVVLDLSSSGL